MQKTTNFSYRLEFLASPGFIIGLILLLLNDYYFKQSFPGLITGKLSDFAGLFIIGLLFIKISPRNSTLVLALVGLTFIAWKSSISDPFIRLWNLNAPLQIGRTVDYTDLVALIILPAVKKYSLIYKPLSIKPLLLLPIFALTVFSIMGTSPARYGVRVDIPEKTSEYQIQKKESEKSVPVLNTIQKAAISLGLECLSCEEGSYYKKYIGRGVLLQANYDSDLKKVYLGIYSKDPYRMKYDEQKIEVEKIRVELEEILKDYSYEMQEPEQNGLFESYYQAKITIKSPTNGVPFSSKYNGAGNKGIMFAHKYVNEYLSSHGFRRSSKEYCYPIDSDFERNMCRKYIAGKTIGPLEESVSAQVTMSGVVDWFGTYLYVEFRKVTEDSSIDLENIATEIHSQLKNQLPKDVEISFEII